MARLFLCPVHFFSFLAIVGFLSFCPLMAQESTDGPVALYDKKLAGSQQLYNGTEYKMHRSRNGEHPFFLSDKYIVGTLNYDGVRYPSVPMYFDIAKGQLVTPYYYDGTWMVFINELISGFELQGHQFHYVRDSIENLSTPGFFEVLYDGKLKLYLRHTKAFQEIIEGTEIHAAFRESQEYFLVRGGRAIRWSEGERIPSLLKDNQADLRVFLRKNPKAGKVDLIRFAESLID